MGLLAAVFHQPGTGAAVGNIGVCYEPMHNLAYPLNGATFDDANLRAAIDADFALMANVTNVRTFYSQYYGVNITDYAAKYGLKLNLGAFMTYESWQIYEVDATFAAIQNYPNSVESVLVGNENLQNGITAAQILDIVSTIKKGVGADAAAKVKFGTVQRITDYVTSTYDSETAQLAAGLDILGVNIYPFFSESYDSNSPTAPLDSQWRLMATKFSASKMRLTETGFPTAGSPSVLSPSIQPSLSSSITYYNALVSWKPPSGNTAFPKLWFGMFDGRPDDNMFAAELKRHFGFLTYDRQSKATDYPYALVGTYPNRLYGSCDNSRKGVKCCPVGTYCMPSSSSDYQCIPKPTKCSNQMTYVEFSS